MAWGTTAISAEQQARYLADKPCIVPVNRINADASAWQWRTSGSLASGSDNTNAAYPTRNAYDYNGHTETRATTSVTTHYYLGQVNTQNIDTLIVYSTLGSNLTATLQIADDNAFTSNLETVLEIGDWVGDRGRAMFTVTDYYDTVTYARIKTVTSGSAVHRAHTIFAGRRYHLPFRQTQPFDPQSLRSYVSDSTSPTGLITRYVMSGGQAEIPYSLIYDDDDRSDILTWISTSTNDMTRPFIYVPNPYTDPDTWYLMRFAEQEFAPRRAGPREWQLDFAMLELPPYLANGD